MKPLGLGEVCCFECVVALLASSMCFFQYVSCVYLFEGVVSFLSWGAFVKTFGLLLQGLLPTALKVFLFNDLCLIIVWTP